MTTLNPLPPEESGSPSHPAQQILKSIRHDKREGSMLCIGRLIYERLYRLIPILDEIPVQREPYLLEKDGEVPVNIFIEKRTPFLSQINLCCYPFDRHKQPMASPHVDIQVNHAEKVAKTIIYVDCLKNFALESKFLKGNFNGERQIDYFCYRWLSKLERSGFELTTRSNLRVKLPKACEEIFHSIYSLVPSLDTLPAGETVKLTAEGFMDLNVAVLSLEPEKIILALSHSIQGASGNAVYDFEIKVLIRRDRQTAQALSYSDSSRYCEVYPFDGMVNVKAMKDLNDFLYRWLDYARRQGYRLKAPQNQPPFPQL